jgi:hypothetical protein
MTSRDFCYWLQGFFELGGTEAAQKGLTPAQAECVARHLRLVFAHEIDHVQVAGDPRAADELRKKLDEIHSRPPWARDSDALTVQGGGGDLLVRC